MSLSTTVFEPSWATPRVRTIFAGLFVLAVGASGFGLARLIGSPSASSDASITPGKSVAKSPGDPNVVEFARDRWPSAGLTIEPAVAAPLAERVWRTGRVVLNEDRFATISSPVEGIVRDVKVRLGQEVKAGDVLAILDSREFGQAKLELVKARLALDSAQAQAEWTRTITSNADELVKDLAVGIPLSEIELRFKNRPIGEWRQQLLTAYSKRHQSKALLDDQTTLGNATVAGWTLRQSRSDYEMAEATFRALCEELRFQTRNQARAAEQKLLEAQASEETAKAHLLMMGYGRDEIAKLTPLTDGDRISFYPIRAPFGGTIIEKHTVLAGRVGPNATLFQIADLSTVWIQADLFDADLPLLRSPNKKSVVFRAPAAGIEERQAEVFYAGDIIDVKSRSMTLSAITPNADRALKPGLFVEVGLPRPDSAPVTQVPTTAIQRNENATYVFVHEGGDTFRRTDVVLGRSAGKRTEIRSGLKAGAAVVVEGGFILKSEMLRDLMGGD
jgi:cobalt-zinc-cadmium efflux system membrane fusion protein